MPAKSGIQHGLRRAWIPAFAGMTPPAGTDQIRCCGLELIPDPRADLGQARVDVGAQARVRDVLDVGDNVPVLTELVAEAARFAEVPTAACVDAVRFVAQRRGVDRGAKLALEEETLVERNAPGEASEAVARLALGIDHRADVDARIEKPRKPRTADVVGIADRIGQEFARDVYRRALVMNPVVGINADARLIEKVDPGGRSRRDDRSRRRHGVVDPQTGHVGGRRRRNRQCSSHESSNESLPPRPHSTLDSAPRANLNRGAHGSRQAREAPASAWVAQSERVWRRRHTGAIDIPPTRFWRFSHGNAIVLEVLLKDRKLRSRSGAPR